MLLPVVPQLTRTAVLRPTYLDPDAPVERPASAVDGDRQNAPEKVPIASVPTGDRCWHFTFTPDDRRLLVACGRSNEVVVIDAVTLKPIKRIEDKKTPWGVVTYPKSVGSLDWPM